MLYLQGNITEQSCAVSGGGDNQTIKLGEWNLRQLQGSAGRTTEARDFGISLENCPSGLVSVSFTGTQAEGNPDLLAAGGGQDEAKNIAIQLMDNDRSPLALNTWSRKVAVKTDGTVVLKFYARYITLTSAITAGEADGQASFTLAYN
ncbi:adhesin [Salmonella enterica subsp. enterica serovar Choleraesuis]|nr:adhesin [Salmonella enterica subsp. enterica serovar Choleraesuis]